ncbi:ATPase domain-containing protein [Haloarchaeobius amylolyticus]|uniref:ATPase domain-containing protein n=1 Tax=Haloarchaeobius amylolyticus TaxID=1198296 RepID=UPI00226DDB3B|nr:ATPase domain-containing protein [Haloarchaeobius amylolyticus]
MAARVSTGIQGLDEVLHGGYIRNRSYLVRGEPGVGKTLLGLHFLIEGVTQGENALFINLGAPEADIRADAEGLGLDLDGVDILDLSPASDFFVENKMYDIFTSPEVERGEFTAVISDAVERYAPERVFVDPLTQFRYLSPDEFQFREEVLSFLQYLKENGCTTLFSSQSTQHFPDDDLQFVSDGNVHLYYGRVLHHVEVTKMRGSEFEKGPQTVEIRNGGMQVFPLLRPGRFKLDYEPVPISSGNENLDALLNGGVERGTTTLISGPTGVGKTTVAMQFLLSAAERGERGVIYLFEESENTFVLRAESLGMPIKALAEQDMISVMQVDAHEHSAEQFSRQVRREVEDGDTRHVLIDGIDGYVASISGEERDLISRLHAVVAYLRNVGVTTFLTSEMETITGQFRPTSRRASYLADNIIFLGYFELGSRLHRSIGVLKKRASGFDHAIHAFSIGDDGITVGKELDNLHGILSGTPMWYERDIPSLEELD